MPGWLKNTLIAADILTLCWGGAIAYWRTSTNTPATGDLLLVLLAAPLCLLAAVWLGKKVVFARPKAAPAVATPAAQTAPATPPSAPPLALLASALRASHGASAEELAAAIAANQARPDLDPELVDDDGFPVTSARSDAALDEALQEEFTEWLTLAGMADLQLGETHWRALTLGTAVVRDLAGEALLQLLPEGGTPPPLRLLPLLPASWTVEQRHAAGLWLEHTVAQFGWPVEHLTRVEVARDATLASAIGQCAADSQAVTMLVACDSHIAQETVDGWTAANMLATAARAEGRIPGEGAAGLLLTSLAGARYSADTAFARLYPLAETRRDVASDSAKRPDTKRFIELAQRATSAAGIALTDVAAIAADTDHRISRGLELMGLASGSLPQLDGGSDVMRIGASTGTCGAVTTLCALALAHNAALSGNAPVLFVSNDDPFTCSMAVVSPTPAPAMPA